MDDQSNEHLRRASRLVTEGEEYVAAIRDWVKKGETEAFMRCQTTSLHDGSSRAHRPETEADASFALAAWFQQAGDVERGEEYFARAQATESPPTGTITGRTGASRPVKPGPKWLEKFQKLDEPYIRSSI